MAKKDLSGIWQSHYRFNSSSRQGTFEAWHYVKLIRTDNQVVVESLPGDINHSYLLMRLSINDDTLTGTWQETTDPKGYYKGVTYQGAIQAVVRSDGHIDGRWVGANKERELETGPWELTYIGEELPAGTKAPEPTKVG